MEVSHKDTILLKRIMSVEIIHSILLFFFLLVWIFVSKSLSCCHLGYDLRKISPRIPTNGRRSLQAFRFWFSIFTFSENVVFIREFDIECLSN